MFKKLRKNEKGFTLAELLIVVAIIGVLVAISIPIFTAQLEKAREATDLANIRSAYAECSTAVLTSTDGENGVKFTAAAGDKPASASKDVKLTQKQTKWQTADAETNEIAGTKISTLPDSGTVTVTVKGDGTWTCGAKTTTP